METNDLEKRLMEGTEFALKATEAAERTHDQFFTHARIAVEQLDQAMHCCEGVADYSIHAAELVILLMQGTILTATQGKYNFLPKTWNLFLGKLFTSFPVEYTEAYSKAMPKIVEGLRKAKPITKPEEDPRCH